MQKSILKKSEILESVRPIVLKTLSDKIDNQEENLNHSFTPFNQLMQTGVPITNELPATIITNTNSKKFHSLIDGENPTQELSLAEKIKKSIPQEQLKQDVDDSVLEDIPVSEIDPSEEDFEEQEKIVDHQINESGEEKPSVHPVISQNHVIQDEDIHEKSEKYQELIHQIKTAEKKLEDLNQDILNAQSKTTYIIDDAKKQAEQEIQVVKNQAISEAQTQGLKKGEDEIKRLVTLLQTVTSQIVDEKNKILTSLEGDLVDLTLLIAGKVVKSITESYKRVVYDNVVAAISKLKIKSDIIVKVSPNDLPTIQKYKSNLLSEINGIENLQFMEDPSIDAGGCVIISDFGSIDAKISSQLAEIEEQVRRISPHKNF